jgi:hypothetical protein
VPGLVDMRVGADEPGQQSRLAEINAGGRI